MLRAVACVAERTKTQERLQGLQVQLRKQALLQAWQQPGLLLRSQRQSRRA